VRLQRQPEQPERQALQPVRRLLVQQVEQSVLLLGLQSVPELRLQELQQELPQRNRLAMHRQRNHLRQR
jgi:hypothetical protein